MSKAKRKKSNPNMAIGETLSRSWGEQAGMNVDNAIWDCGFTVRGLEHKIKQLQEIKEHIDDGIQLCILWGTVGNLTTRRLEQAKNSLDIAMSIVPWARSRNQTLVTDYEKPEEPEAE